MQMLSTVTFLCKSTWELGSPSFDWVQSASLSHPSSLYSPSLLRTTILISASNSQIPPRACCICLSMPGSLHLVQWSTIPPQVTNTHTHTLSYIYLYLSISIYIYIYISVSFFPTLPSPLSLSEKQPTTSHLLNPFTIWWMGFWTYCIICLKYIPRNSGNNLISILRQLK